MEPDQIRTLLGVTVLFGLILGLMLIAYEDNIPKANWKKLRCLLGWHQLTKKIGRIKIALYYCQNCKKARKFPDMKLIDGGRKLRNNRFNH